MFIRILSLALLFAACDKTNLSDSSEPAGLEDAKKVISRRNTAGKARKLTSVSLRWIPNKVFLEEFAGSDPVKKEVISISGIKNDQEITNGLGFYSTRDPGAAFANTYKAEEDIVYRGEQSRYAEIFFQAEKVFLYSDTSIKDNFKEALKKLTELHNNKVKVDEDSWKNDRQWSRIEKSLSEPREFPAGSFAWFPLKVKQELSNKFTDPNWFKKWDKKSVKVMSKIHAARFKAEPDLFLSLVATKPDSIIVENAKANDIRWGNGADGKGRNLLGLLYMTHRQRFFNDFAAKNPSKTFNPDDPVDVAFMLRWLKSYDG